MPQITEDTVYVDSRVPPSSVTNTARHCCYRVTGAAGKRFRCAIGKRSDYGSTDITDWYRVVWATDPHGENWQEFDNVIGEGEYWVGVNDEPFADDVIYVASLPQFTLTHMTNKVDEWIASPFTQPTASGDVNYVIGSLPATTGPNSKTLPAYDIRAFTVGTGPVHVALTGGVHPQELGEFFIEAAVDTILEDSAQGQTLRDTFTFHVYPTVNPHGSYGGYVRLDPETGNDANRRWDDATYTSQIKTIYTNAWAQDLVNVDAHLDYHSVPPRPVSGPEREIWVAQGAGASPLNSSFLAAVGARTTFKEYESTATDAMRAVINSTYGCQVSATCEHTHTNRTGYVEWAQWGRDSVLALLDISSEFDSAAEPDPDPIEPGEPGVDQYFTDFSANDSGVQPTDWTRRLAGDFAWIVEDAAGVDGSKALVSQLGAADSRNGLSWNLIDGLAGRSHVEVLYRVSFPSLTGAEMMAMLRASGDATNVSMYRHGARPGQTSNHIACEIYNNGTFLSPVARVEAYPYQINTWYKVRTRINGSDHFIKLWPSDEAEPAGWMATGANDTIDMPGWVGLFKNRPAAAVIDFFSVGINGAEAYDPDPATP